MSRDQAKPMVAVHVIPMGREYVVTVWIPHATFTDKDCASLDVVQLIQNAPQLPIMDDPRKERVRRSQDNDAGTTLWIGMKRTSQKQALTLAKEVKKILRRHKIPH